MDQEPKINQKSVTEQQETSSVSSESISLINKYGKTISRKGNQTSKNIAGEIKNLGLIVKILLIGIVGAIILLSVDLYRDSSLHSRVTDLEKDYADFRIDFSTKLNNINIPDNNKIKSMESTINCFKISKYFNNNCFNQ